MSQPLCLASCFLPLDDENSRWWKRIQDALAHRGMELVLISSGPAADRELRTIVLPLWLHGFGQAYGTSPAPITLEEPLARALAQRDRAWLQQEHRDLSEFTTGLGTCQQVLRGVLDELQPAIVLVWGSSLPQSVVLLQLALQRGLPCWVLERGLLPGTLMLEMHGHGGHSELNWSFALQRVLRQETDTQLFEAAREHYSRLRASKYAQGEYLDPGAFRRQFNPDGRKIVAALLQNDAASGLVPASFPGTRLHAPGLVSCVDAVDALAAAARAQNALLLVKPHPIDGDDYSRFESEHVRIVRHAHLHSLIEAADVVACMTSTAQYEALLFEKPLLLLARSALAGKGVAYEAFNGAAVPAALRRALDRSDFTARLAMARRFLNFVLRSFSIALDDSLPFGASVRDLVDFLARNARNAGDAPSSETGLQALGRRFQQWESATRVGLANTTTRLVALPGPHAVAVHAVTNRAAFEQVYQMELAGRIQAQQQLNPGTGARFTLRGYCAVCGCEQHFATDFMFSRADANGRLQPAWRERQVCQCQLNARQRSCFHVLADCLGLPEGAVVYCTEQTTELFRHIRCRFPLAVGSEFLGDKIPLGTPNEQGIRNEDITRLTFPDDAFDCVFSIDVLEHVPEYKAGLAELARCLKPGGKLLLTAPFHFGKDTTIVRAGFDADGKLTHYLPPVYHGDPLSTEGCLCFNDFGWDLLDELANAGFTDVALHAFTSEEYGYIGLQYVLLATRQEVLWQRSSRRTLLRHAAPKPPVNRQAELLNEPVETLLQRASAATDQSQWTEAGRLLQALTNRLPDDVGVWQRRVECSRKQGHSVLTDLIVEEALERHPEWQAVLTAS